MDVAEQNSIAKAIRSDADWYDDFIDLVKVYYSKTGNSCGGSLHIVLDDENIEDSHVSWCAGYACGKGDEEGHDIASLMELMTIEQRERVVSNYEDYAL